MSGTVIDVQFRDVKPGEEDDKPPVSEFFEDVAHLAETSAVSVERVSPEHAEQLREFAEGSREVGREVSKWQEAWDRVKSRAYELSDWAKRHRGNPRFAARRRFKP